MGEVADESSLPRAGRQGWSTGVLEWCRCSDYALRLDLRGNTHEEIRANDIVGCVSPAIVCLRYPDISKCLAPVRQSPDTGCQLLHRLRDITIIYTEEVAENENQPAHCYAKGIISGSITFHIQLPGVDIWNGILVHLGDGGADGDLDDRGRIVQGPGREFRADGGHWGFG